ncbi:MAG: tetratricopeptide repeat protein [Actinobacteria bacterium]|nr:tetratricopeptide repeat protein [Actinomycetota bacterium]
MATQPQGLTNAALRGAVDLGALAQARQAQQQAASGAPGGAGTGAYVKNVTVADFEVEVIQQSLTVPVVLDLWASWCGPCKQLTPVLESLAAEYDGRFVLAKVDVDAEQQIAAAFQVQSIPSVFAVVKGQPIPLFQGALPAPQVRQYLDELLRVAAENGVTGRAVADVPAAAAEEPAEPVDDPTDALFDAAGEALVAGDWDAATAAYQQVLAANPGDPDAQAGLTLVALQRRIDGIDPVAAVAAADADPADVQAAVVAADVELVNGDPAAAYARLVTAVSRASGDDRDAARARLLELFELAPPDDPEVAKARRALAAALF